MSIWRLIARGLGHHWRSHTGVVLGVACAAAILVGALVVGDSVRASLREQALQRIGRFDSVLASGDRFVTTQLASRIAQDLGDATCTAVLQLPGVASNSTGSQRTGIVDVLGVTPEFFAMSTRGASRARLADGHALLNARLAAQLHVTAGDELVLRVEKPSLMPSEATMATVDDIAHAVRITVDDVVEDEEFARFGLRASQVPPFNVFVSRDWLQREIELPDRANLLLVDAEVERADRALQAQLSLADAELELREHGSSCELRSQRVFLAPATIAAAQRLVPDAVGVFTYFVNSLRAGDRTTPYSMVAGIGPLLPEARSGALQALSALAPRQSHPPGIVLNAWLAEDLGAKVGDRVAIAYYVMNDALQLEQRTHDFTVQRIVPLAGAAADPGLMPAFPGLAEARSCTDWEPGVPVELDQLDDRDQAYWDQHRGTPKAFVSLPTAQSLWQNRFGDLTALRATAAAADTLRKQLPRELSPASIGLYFQDLRGPAIAAGEPATDFGALYFGLSFFLILAALLLTALLNAFGVESRSSEIGSLLAVGFEARIVRSMLVREALLLATLGSIAGAGLGVGYAQAVLTGLDGLWRDTIGETTLTASVQPESLAIGAASTLLAALLATFWTARRATQKPAVELLAARAGVAAAGDHGSSPRRRRITSLLIAAAAGLGAIWMVATAEPMRATSAFFGGGALLLLALLFACRALLAHLAVRTSSPARSLRALGLRNTCRRPDRSLASIALLASGSFLVLAIQANRLSPPEDPSQRSSGTGGFALFGRSTLPVLRDLGTAAAEDAYALDQEALQNVDIVPLRVRPGDDASCLNLATAQNPQLLGVQAQQLDERGAFRFTRTVDDTPLADGWQMLDADFGDGVVPAIGDGGSVAWALHKKVGDTLRYRDERGSEFDVRIVATVADSILQGNLLIADRHLRARFPSASGYRMFLIDAPAARVDDVAAELSDALEDIGLELTPTASRLAAFQSIQNTYLSIFQLLGGLGLLLGTVGLGVVVLRNALERRSELAAARALGYSQRDVRRLVWSEHLVLLGLALATGLAAATVAMLPILREARDLSLTPSLLLLASLALSGAFWVWLASVLATRARCSNACAASRCSPRAMCPF